MIPTMQKNYKPGDMPPEGYLAWHEWAEVQCKAGLKSVACSHCGLWRFQQELSDKFTGTCKKCEKDRVECLVERILKIGK